MLSSFYCTRSSYVPVLSRTLSLLLFLLNVSHVRNSISFGIYMALKEPARSVAPAFRQRTKFGVQNRKTRAVLTSQYR